MRWAFSTLSIHHQQKTPQDSPIPIGHGQTCSAPHMHAACLELLEDRLVPGARVLDVGSGSGFLAAAMAVMVSPGGTVLGVDKHAALVERSRGAVAAALPPDVAAAVTLETSNVLAPGALDGLPPFDVIHVGAAAASLPDSLVAALAPSGRLVIPVGPDVTSPFSSAGQVLKCVDKSADGRTVSEADLMDVRYVPLTEPGEDRHGGL
jgi:protein-L-isoaspartate(D-aspartate) O-methyltransferase